MGCLFTVSEYNPEDYTAKEDEDNNNLLEPLHAQDEEEEKVFLEQQTLLKVVAITVARESAKKGVDPSGGYVDPEVRAASATNSASKIDSRSPKEKEFIAEQQRLAGVKKVEDNEDGATSNSKQSVPQSLSFSGHVKETQQQAASEQHALVDAESVVSGSVVIDDGASVVSDLTSVMSDNAPPVQDGSGKTNGNNNNKKGKNKNKGKGKGKGNNK